MVVGSRGARFFASLRMTKGMGVVGGWWVCGCCDMGRSLDYLLCSE